MCEITNGKIYVADRDLVCYKIMVERGGQLESVYNKYEYEIGREYCVEGFEYRCLLDDVIYEAWYMPLSSFGGWEKNHTVFPDIYLYSNTIKTDLCHTRCGFYSYTYYGNDSMKCGIFSTHCFEKFKCVRCRIPKGSKYMVSDNGEVFISERIIIDDAWSL